MAALVQSASPVNHEAIVVNVPLKGYLEAGLHRDSYEVDLGEMPFPRPFLEDYPRAFSLIASGDSLVADGIHSGDILLVDPDREARVGTLCVVRIDGPLCAATFLSHAVLRLRTPSGRSEDLDASSLDIIGNVVWHMRKM